VNASQRVFLVMAVVVNVPLCAAWWVAGFQIAAITHGVTAALLTPPLYRNLRTKQ